uniref:Uncharacterized protein n=1 Tax=Anguilla anguilla TaxID=7936 RepID=A0A0E9TPZ7_ANGAN
MLLKYDLSVFKWTFSCSVHYWNFCLNLFKCQTCSSAKLLQQRITL